MICGGNVMYFYEKTVLHNDSFTNTPSIHIEEKGFQFGDGVYEVIRIYNGKLFTMDEHLNRLYRSADEIKLTMPYDKKTLMNHLKELLRINEFSSDGIIYLQVTRGNAPRNHSILCDTEPNLFAYVKKLSRPLDDIRNGVSVYATKDERWLRCDIKSLNLLPNCLAKNLAEENDCVEAILYREDTNQLTEGSSSNLFGVKDGVIYTHPANNLILNGITREKVFKFAHLLGIKIIDTPFIKESLKDMDELFLSSTTKEIMPITKVKTDNAVYLYPVGDVSSMLQRTFENNIDDLSNDINYSASQLDSSLQNIEELTQLLKDNPETQREKLNDKAFMDNLLNNVTDLVGIKRNLILKHEDILKDSEWD